MKLYLHIGTEKTGSSFLQTLLARNRDYLFENGIEYPHAGKREEDMMSGRISPGNGLDLFKNLKNQKWEAVKDQLNAWITKGLERKASIVLISNENLVEAFSDKLVWTKFLELCRELKIIDIKMLLFLREPVDQALSLYKHRAKGGNAGEIEQWIQNGYFLPEHLRGLMANMGDGEICIFRKYRMDTGYMVKALFEDWLNIKIKTPDIKESVNPSLTISELLFLKKINGVNKDLTKELYQNLLAIPKDQKASDQNLSAYYKKVITDHLRQYNSVWEQCNLLLKEDEKIELSQGGAEANDNRNENKVLAFSEVQAESIALFMSKCTSPAFGVRLRKQRAKQWLAGLRKKLVN